MAFIVTVQLAKEKVTIRIKSEHTRISAVAPDEHKDDVLDGVGELEEAGELVGLHLREQAELDGQEGVV